jgi:hypothetical protein
MTTELTKKLFDLLIPDTTDLGNMPTFERMHLSEDKAKVVEAELIKHFDFSKIVWMDLPSGLTEDKLTPIVAKSEKLNDDNDKHTGRVGYIYTISFTPLIYDPSKMYIPVKDGCVFAPTIYNPETFEPKQSITLTWSPDFPQDIDAPENDGKQMVRDLLEKVLANPEDYRPEGFRGCIVRFATV